MIPKSLLEGDFETLATDSRRMAPLRIGCSAMMTGLFLLHVGVLRGAWLALSCAAVELWIWVANLPLRDGQPITSTTKLSRLGALAGAGAFWTAMAVGYWQTGSRPLEIQAIVLLAAVLMLAQSLSFLSWSAFVALGAPAAIALLLAPTQFMDAGPLVLVTLILGTVMTLVFFLKDAGLNVSNAKALRNARALAQRQTEGALAANEAKTAFLAMMSHELRTPMNGVLGMARALKQTPLDKRQTEYVAMLLRSGDGLMTILNDILDISKIEVGKLELESMAFDLHNVGQGVHDLWSEVASAKGVRLTYVFDDTAPRWVTGDPTRVRQIMLNLVSNALKFTKQGEVRLSVHAIDDHVVITVKDTGLGIPALQQAKLFQPFAQADTSTSRRFGGTGLGLAICKQLAELMGGGITLESEFGVGSVFRVSAPLAVAEPQPEDDDDDASTDFCGLRILVADDNAINQAVAQAILQTTRAEVSCVSDGAEALDRLRSDPFDVVLMDVHMPIMDGLEALRRIRAGEAGSAAIPIIALTADAMAGADERLFAAGFDDVQPKPINPATLFAAIAGVCRAGSPAVCDGADARLASGAG